jgi:protein-S-isoprenylcysteine O-methyltransferase Ste14
MENNEQQQVVYRPGMIHTIISHSYITFLLSIVFGSIFDAITPIRILNNYVFQYIGFAMIILGSVLTYWAQKSSSISKRDFKIKNLPINFEYGPYKHTRNPSYLGVFIMIIGLGFFVNSIFIIIFGLISYFIVKFIFIKQEEYLLSDKYGQVYLDYKNKVKNRL